MLCVTITPDPKGSTLQQMIHLFKLALEEFHALHQGVAMHLSRVGAPPEPAAVYSDIVCGSCDPNHASRCLAAHLRLTTTVSALGASVWRNRSLLKTAIRNLVWILILSRTCSVSPRFSYSLDRKSLYAQAILAMNFPRLRWLPLYLR